MKVINDDGMITGIPEKYPQDLDNFSYYKGRKYSSGGILTGKEDLSVYKGNKHSKGGIDVDSNGLPSKTGTNEVEGEEAKLTIRDKEYIFSSKLIIE